MRRGTLAVLLALVVLASGCGGKEPPREDDSREAGTGRLHGIVLDESNFVVAGAYVTVLLTDFATVTDPHGRFLLEGAPAGNLRVVVTAEGFASASQGVHLPDGGAVELRFVLSDAPRFDAYNYTRSFDGQVSCGLPEGVACTAAPTVTPPQLFAVEPYLVAIVLELSWTAPASGVNPRLALDLFAATATACGPAYAGAEGEDPVRLVVTDGIPISGGHQCVGGRPPPDGATAQQSYTIYATMFYHEPPPEGFTALP